MKDQTTYIRTALKANAAFSLLSGLTMIIFSTSLTELMNLPKNLILLIVGVGLLIFVVQLLYNAYKEELSISQVKQIIVADWVWVAGSVIMLFFNPIDISTYGLLIIAFIALIVGILATFQMRGLRKLKH